MRQKCHHKYKRTKLSKTYIVYKCEKPGCTHYISPALITGKLAECWRCGDVFVIKQKHLELARPHCDNCTNSKSGSKKLRPPLDPKVQESKDVSKLSVVREKFKGDLAWLDDVEGDKVEPEKSYEDLIRDLRSQ